MLGQSWLFVTADSFQGGDLGGLQGADENVNLEAWFAGWIPDWDGDEIVIHAVLSDSTTNARDRLDIRGPIYNMANELIAQNAADLWDGNVGHAVQYDAFGQSVNAGTRVWTGTSSLGIRSAAENCGDWLNPLRSGIYGNPLSTSGTWVNTNAMNGTNSARLYGLSAPITVLSDGDYNRDGTVDASDYVVWRKNNGPTSDYNLWRANFGESIFSSGAALPENAPVPEPASRILVVIVIAVRTALPTRINRQRRLRALVDVLENGK